MTFLLKDPGAVLDYLIDWGAEYLDGEPALTIAASDLAAIGSGPAQVEVRQIGDFAASRPAQASINLL